MTRNHLHYETSMAEKASMQVTSNQESAESEPIPGFKDINSYSQQALRALMMATKSSNELPSAGDDFDYYSSFESFRNLMDLESSRILQMIQTMMRYHGAKGNLATSSETKEMEEKFDVLVDANDQLLERVGSFLDEASGVKKKEAPLVIASTSTPKNTISGSWNKKVLQKASSSTSSFRLLAARHVERPQSKFKEKVDNSSTPFVPKIKYKHNAMKPLPESLQILLEEDRVKTREDDEVNEKFVFPHPYQYELDHFTPDPSLLTRVEPKVAQSIDDTPLMYVDNIASLQKICNILRKEAEIAIDLEHHSYRTFLGITSLMQISTRSQDFIIDVIALRDDVHILNEIFTDPKVVKVFHGADSDIEWLQRDLGLYVVNMFDTGQAARVLSLQRFSLAYLLAQYCQVEANKEFQLADWRIRPLPEALINYAREDTHYLLYIYDCLRNELLTRANNQDNILRSVIQRSTQLCAKKYEKPQFTENSHLELYRKSRKLFNSQQMEALRGIYAWRDRIARSEDESTGYVLPNHMLLQIAEILPREPQGVLACCNPIPPLVRQNIGEIHYILKTARKTPLTKPERKKPKMQPSKSQHPKYSIDSMLRCPHDLSHPDNVRHQPQYTPTDTSLFASSASMFKSAQEVVRRPPVEIAEKPHLAIFGWSQKQPSTRKLNTSQRKAAKIKSSFRNPFEKYLPSSTKNEDMEVSVPELSGDDKPPDVAPVLRTKIEWKLLPNTPKQKKQHVVKVKPVIALTAEKQAAITQEELEMGEVPLSQQMPSKKRKLEDDEDEDIEEIPQADSSPNVPPTSDSTSRKEKKMRHTLESLETLEFKPHEYSETDMTTMFKGVAEDGRGKHKSFKGRPDHEFRKPSKPKTNPGSGKKSMSFGNKDGRQGKFTKGNKPGRYY